MTDQFNAPVLVALRRLIVSLPGRDWQLGHRRDSPWLELDFSPVWGQEATPENASRKFAIWIDTAAVYECDERGAVGDDPIDIERIAARGAST